MKEVRIIKRYQNRKLYDTFQSCYVTLEEISQIIREGNEIQVIDNKTKNDITYMTQLQLLADQERKSLKPGDTELLKRVIRAEEGTLTGYIRGLEAQLNLNFPTSIAEDNEAAAEKKEVAAANKRNQEVKDKKSISIKKESVPGIATEISINEAGLISIKNQTTSLFSILNELLTALSSLNVATGTGPSSPPLNAPQFAKIQAELSTFLTA